jgi:hypothetical protein
MAVAAAATDQPTSQRPETTKERGGGYMMQGIQKGSVIVAIFLLAGLGSSCRRPVEWEIEGPSMRLLNETDIPSSLPQGDYRLTNGQGETLMEVNNLSPEQEHTASFPLDKLDGTIHIVATKSGATIYTQTLHHTPGRRVRLEWNSEDYRFDLTEDAAPHSPGARGGGGGDRD